MGGENGGRGRGECSSSADAPTSTRRPHEETLAVTITSAVVRFPSTAFDCRYPLRGRLIFFKISHLFVLSPSATILVLTMARKGLRASRRQR